MNNMRPGIFCPACKMRNEPGAILCIYCNTPLPNDFHKTISLGSFTAATAALDDSSSEILDAPAYDKKRFMDFELPSKGITLINIENAKPIAIREDAAFFLGRASDEIKLPQPLVDLTPFDGLALGISRVHAMLRKTKKGYQIIDLDSSNGTWLENRRLIPQKPYLVESGDRLRLARLNVLVFYPRT